MTRRQIKVGWLVGVEERGSRKRREAIGGGVQEGERRISTGERNKMPPVSPCWSPACKICYTKMLKWDYLTSIS